MTPNPRIVYLIVGALAFAVIGYITTLSACALLGLKPDPKVLEYLKDIGLLCAGSISSILSRTGQAAEKPTETKIINTPEDPANVKESKPTP